MSAEDVQLYYQICVNGRKDLPYASDEQAAFDMTLLRLFAFKPMAREALQELESSSLQPTSLPSSSLPSSSLPSNNIEFSEALPIHEHEHEHKYEHEQALDQQMQDIEQQAVALQASAIASAQNEVLASHQKESTEIQTKVSDESTFDSPVFDSQVSTVLATRNMLRSRKKQLAQQEKKPGDAIARPAPLNEAVELPKPELPKPGQSYQAENIDPATIHKANQVDQWAHMIDSMELTARLRQLAIHATIDENSTEENLILRLDQATKHLYTAVAQQQLQQSISQFLSRDITVTINIVEQTIADPYQIQSHINDKRYDYAKELLINDEIVQGLIQTCQATLDDESISAV